MLEKNGREGGGGIQAYDLLLERSFSLELKENKFNRNALESDTVR